MDEKLQKLQLRTNVSIQYQELKKFVERGQITKAQAQTYLADYTWTQMHPNAGYPDEKVLAFINNIVSYFPSEEKLEAIRNLFVFDYCYYFAIMLKEAFERGTVSWCAPYGHICWVDDNGTPYDIDGVAETECTYFVPVSYIQEGLAEFKHVPGDDFFADKANEAYLEQAVSRFEADLIASAGVVTEWCAGKPLIEKISGQIQETLLEREEDDLFFHLDNRYWIGVEIIPLTEGSTEVAATLYTAEKKEVNTAVCESYLTEEIVKNLQLLMEYADNWKPETWAKIYARNIWYYLPELKNVPYECNAPEWMDQKIFLLVTYDEAEEEGEEDVLTFELRTDADVLLIDRLPVKDISENKIADMLVAIRDDYGRNTK